MPEVALVTGGAQRIGAEIVRHLHNADFDIALHYRQSARPAQALAQELCAIRPNSCQLFQADLEDAAAVQDMAEAVLAAFSEGIKVLVNNASGFRSTPIDSCTQAGFDAMLGSNLRGPYFLIQALLPALRQRGGSIVNILDVHAEHPLPEFNAYCAAKAGMASLTRSLALELAPEVRVNGIAPGAILWPNDDEAYSETARRETIARTPLGRLGEPADIAQTVRFLACEAPFITGQVIRVDGGRTLEA